MAKEEYIVDGFLFSTQAEYQRAKKEKETIAYLTANTDESDPKAQLRIYNRAVEKDSFQTIIGQQFLQQLRRKLVNSQIVTEDTLAPVRIVSAGRGAVSSAPEKKGDKQAERYKKAYEDAVANQKIKNMVIGFLILIIAGMIVITASGQYSIFTYFTDYKTKIHNEVVDELEGWQERLEEKEAELQQREAALAGEDGQSK